MPSDEKHSRAETDSLSRDTIVCGLLFLLAAASVFFFAGDTSEWSAAAAGKPSPPPSEGDLWLFRAMVAGLAAFGLLECLAGLALGRRWPGSRPAVLALALVIAALAIATAGQMIYRLAQGDFGFLLPDLLFLWLFGGYAWQVIAHSVPWRGDSSPPRADARSSIAG